VRWTALSFILIRDTPFIRRKGRGKKSREKGGGKDEKNVDLAQDSRLDVISQEEEGRRTVRKKKKKKRKGGEGSQLFFGPAASGSPPETA